MTPGGFGKEQPVVIWGSGAMGGSIGAALSQQGVDVLFVDQVPEHVQAMNDKGLQITGPVQDFITPVRAALPSDVRGLFPWIFLCVKSHHTREAVAQLRPHLGEDGAVVSIQNGLCEMEIAELVGPGRTVGAFVNFGADYLEPGVIHRGNRGATVIGEIDGTLSDRIREAHGLLCRFEPRAILTENIFGFLWGKLAYAALLFATALTDESIADVLANKEFRPFLISLAREVVDVASTQGVSLESFDGFDPKAFLPGGALDSAERSLDDLVTFNRGSAKTHSGIWRDLAVHKRATEVDAQLGWVERVGRTVDVPTPLTSAVIVQIHQIEAGVRPRGWENLAEIKDREG